MLLFKHTHIYVVYTPFLYFSVSQTHRMTNLKLLSSINLISEMNSSLKEKKIWLLCESWVVSGPHGNRFWSLTSRSNRLQSYGAFQFALGRKKKKRQIAQSWKDIMKMAEVLWTLVWFHIYLWASILLWIKQPSVCVLLNWTAQIS